MLVDYCSVAKSNLRFGEKVKLVWNGVPLQQCLMLARVRLNSLTLHVLPSVRADLIDVHVRKDVSFIATPIDIELIEVSDERVVCSWLGGVLRIQVNPLVL